MMDMIQSVAGLLFMFVTPGILLSRNRQLPERIIEAAAITLSLNIVFGYLLASLGLFNARTLWVGLLIVSAASLAYVKRDAFKVDGRELAALAVAAALIFLLVYNTHANFLGNSKGYMLGPADGNPFPHHFDEWSHIAQARHLMGEGSHPRLNPYLPQEWAWSVSGFEHGFHVFLAEYSVLTGFDLVTGYQYLPALFTLFSALMLFLLVKKAVNPTAGFLSLMFFVSIKSNVNVLGNWFLTPSMMSVLFVFASFHFFLAGKRILAFLNLACLALTYPPAMAFAAAPVLFKLLKKKEDYYKLFIIIIIASFLVLAVPKLRQLSSHAFFPSDWAQGFSLGNSQYSIIMFTLGFYGIAYSAKDERLRAPLLFTALGVATIISHKLLGFTIIMPAVRSVYFLQAGLAIFAAVGTMKLLSLLNADKRSMALGVAAILLLQFHGYYSIPDEGLRIAPVMTNREYEVMRKMTDTEAIVMADPVSSTAVYPTTGNRVFAILGSNLAGGKRNLQYRFFTTEDCTLKERVINKNWEGSVYVLSKKEIVCGFLKEEEGNEALRLYTMT